MVRFLCALTLLLLPLLSGADGIYFAPQFEEIASGVPSQRAVLKFDGREEVLLIESDLSGPVGSYGWVVPLPSRPSYVKSVNPAYVRASFAQVQPPIKGEMPSKLTTVAIVVFLIAFTALSSGWRYRNRARPVRPFLLLIEVAIVAGIGSLFLKTDYAESPAADSPGAMGAEMSKARAGFEVESLGTVGAFEVSVISGDNVSGIRGWLTDHGFEIPPQAVPVMEAYSKENWVFLAAEVRKDWAGTGPPHPLKAVFPTTEAVYPMRLTGIQTGPLKLELLIVSDRTAAVPGMAVWSSAGRDLLIPVKLDKADKELYEGWESGLYGMSKGRQFWTYLRGEFQPSQMREDFKVTWSPRKEYQREVWEIAAARAQAVKRGLDFVPWLATFLGLVLTLMPKPSERAYFIALAITLLGCLTIGSVWYSGVEKVEAAEIRRDREF